MRLPDWEYLADMRRYVNTPIRASLRALIRERERDRRGRGGGERDECAREDCVFVLVERPRSLKITYPHVQRQMHVPTYRQRIHANTNVHSHNSRPSCPRQ